MKTIPCHYPGCGSEPSWDSNFEEGPGPRQVECAEGQTAVWCSFTCAIMDRAYAMNGYNETNGWRPERLREIGFSEEEIAKII